MRTFRRVWQFSFIFILCSTAAWSWGSEGHQIIARIAAANLNPNASQQVATLLGVSVSQVADAMAAAAPWADTIRISHEETAGWHFVDIPRDQPNGKPSDFCPGNNCVTFRLADFRDRLKNNQAGPDSWTRADQLKFLIHFAGDLHQPLHVSTNADRGANCVPVTNYKNDNLHHAWDDDLITAIGKDAGQVATTLQASYHAMTKSQQDALVAGTPDDWASAAHKLGLSKAYGLVSPKIPLANPQKEITKCTEAPANVAKPVHLSTAYFNQNETVVNDQLMMAGARLASILNSIWP